MPFLTLEDPRAKIKGSRDPLGLVPIWYIFARQIVGNLTTATLSARGFTAHLIGRWYGQRLLREERITEDQILPVFERVEQMCAYVRHANSPDGQRQNGQGVPDPILGIERVRRMWAESAGRVPIQADSTGYILADQKVYGLWGLYTVAGRVSGLVEDGAVGLTPSAWDFVEDIYGPALRRHDGQLLPLVTRGGWLPTRANNALLKDLRALLPWPLTTHEAAWYAEWIRDGRHIPTDLMPEGRQARVVALLLEFTNLLEPLDRVELERLAHHAAASDEGLARVFQRILALEALLVPADVVFDLLQTRRGETPIEVAAVLRDRWGAQVPHLDPAAIEELLPQVRQRVGDDTADLLRRTGGAFAAGDYEEAVRALLDWNRLVMEARGGAPWVTLDVQGRLDVAYSGAEQILPDVDELATRWNNSYFLDSLKRITWQLEQAR